jgi:hypothetical protein
MNEMRGGDHLERELRAWLAAEADATSLPTGLRERVGRLELDATPSRAARWWRWPPRPALLGAVSGVLVAAIATGLLVGGLLPIGRPDCSEVTFDRVLAAAEAVPGYRYTMHGTELIGRPNFSGGRDNPTFDYTTATFDVAGAYRAPDAWSLEVVDVEIPEGPAAPSSLIWLINEEWDAYIHVQDADYARAPGASRYSRLPPDRLNLGWFGPSRLTDLLVGGQPIRMSPSDLLERQFTWSVTSTEDGCRLSATDPNLPDEPGMAFVNEFDVDPTTALPRSATHRLATPEIPFASGSGAPRTEYTSTFTFDYSEVPDIRPPTDPERLAVDEGRARDDAMAAETGLVTNSTSLGRGSSELWVVRGTDAVAILLYEEGLLASTRIVSEADDVVVEIVDGEEGRFLILVANDVRVSHVRVELTASDQVLLPGEAGEDRPLAVVDAEGRGDIVTWLAYDESDRELVVNPRPPG